MHLNELGIKENDVIFVNDITSELYKASVEDIFSSKMVGFDSEFMPQLDIFVDPGVAIIQLSTEKKVYIYDMISFKFNDKFGEMLSDLFSNEKVIKVGHSI